MEVLATHVTEIIIMAGLLCLSAFFSGSETALFSLSQVDLRDCRRGGSRTGEAIASLAREPSEFLATVLFCNMLVNILFYSLAASLAGAFVKGYGHAVALAVSLGALLLVIIFGEVTPKNLAVLAPRGFLTVAVLPMYVLHRSLGGVRRLLRRVPALLRRLSRRGESDAEEQFEELRLMLDASAEAGDLSRVESALVSEVIDLAVVKVKEFMTPRVDLLMAEETHSCAELLGIARGSGKTKIPIFRRVRDEIIGVVDVRDLYLANASGPIGPFIQPPVYVSVHQRASATLQFLQGVRTDLAIVVDEYGGTEGIVTLSDVLEEVFGPPPGSEGDDLPIRKVSETQYLLAGDVSLRELRGLLGRDPAPAGVDTIGGLMAYRLGRVPQTSDCVTVGHVELIAETVVRRRVTQVRLEVAPSASSASGSGRSVDGGSA